MKNKTKKFKDTNYSCTMQILYIICRGGLDFCNQHLADFAAFKAMYTPAYISAALLAVKNAEQIKPLQKRNTEATDVRLALEANARLLCEAWQDLKRYIAAGYTDAHLQNALVDAGANYYSSAYSFNWSNLQSLAAAGNDFISKNLQHLTYECFMPATFQARFATQAEACLGLYQDYFDTDRKKTLVATDKVAANNAIYAALISMLADAKSVYRKSPALRRQFTLTHLLSLARGYGFGSLKGYVTNAATGARLQGVVVTVLDKTNHAITSRTGRYGIARLAAGTYMVQLAKENFDTLTIEVIVNTGTSATYNIQLPALAMADMLKVA